MTQPEWRIRPGRDSDRPSWQASAAPIMRSATADSGIGGELLTDQVVVHRWPGTAGQAASLGEHRPDLVPRAEPGHPVDPGGDPICGQFVGDEPEPERRVITVDVEAALIRYASSTSRAATGLAFHA